MNARRTLVTIAGLLSCALVAAVVIASAQAQSALLAGGYTRAYELLPSWSDASATLAQQRLREHDAAAAGVLARRAILASPLDPQGAVALVEVEQRRGHPREADRLLDVLPGLGWRHAPAQYMLAVRAADRDDLNAAVTRMDALLRQGLYREQVLPFLRAATAFADGRDALSRRLALNPKWRAGYLGDLRDLGPDDLAGHEALLARLRRRPNPTTLAEINAYLQRVAVNGAFRTAAAASDRLMGPTPGNNYIRDPAFRHFAAQPAVVGPFDWRPAGEADVRLVATAGGLAVTADGAATGAILRQTLTAPPGAYRLTLRSSPHRKGMGSDLSVALRCRGGAYLYGQRQGKGAPPIRLRFVIPSEKCTVQEIELMLALPSADPIDARISSIALTKE